MLVLTRRPDEALIIEPAQGIDPSMTLGELFQHGPLVIEVRGIHGQQVRIGIDAPMALSIVRDELL